APGDVSPGNVRRAEAVRPADVAPGDVGPGDGSECGVAPGDVAPGHSVPGDVRLGGVRPTDRVEGRQVSARWIRPEELLEGLVRVRSPTEQDRLERVDLAEAERAGSGVWGRPRGLHQTALDLVRTPGRVAGDDLRRDPGHDRGGERCAREHDVAGRDD